MTRGSIHIVGGGSGIGKWFIDHVFSTAESLYCYDVNEVTLRTLSQKIVRCPLTDGVTFDNYSSNFTRNDWILLAIPPNKIEATIHQLARVLKEGSLLVCMTSVQKQGLELLERYAPKTSVYLGCHPLFGNTVPSPAGQIVALINYNEQIGPHKQFSENLSESGLNISCLGLEDHERDMAIVQALTHYCLLAFARTIIENNTLPSDLLKLKTPNFHFLYAFACRVLKISPTTTGSIQSTSEASNIRELFLHTATVLHDKFKKATDAEEHAKIIEELRNPLSGAEVAEGIEVAAIAVDSLQRFEALLLKYKKTGAPFIFRHRASNKFHVVKILDIQHDMVKYEESTKTVRLGDSEWLAIGLNEVARSNYKKLGINLLPPQTTSIKKRSISLLTAEELKDFYKNRIYPISLERNYLNPHGRAEDYFEEWLPKLIKGLWSCEFLDAYRRRGEIEKVTLRLVFNPNCQRDEIIGHVKNLIEENRLALATNKAIIPMD